MSIHPVNPSCIVDLVGQRQVYIWGARHEGYAARLALMRHGITAVGFIDSSSALAGAFVFGLPVVTPNLFFAENSKSKCFIVVASGFCTVPPMVHPAVLNRAATLIPKPDMEGRACRGCRHLPFSEITRHCRCS